MQQAHPIIEINSTILMNESNESSPLQMLNALSSYTCSKTTTYQPFSGRNRKARRDEAR